MSMDAGNHDRPCRAMVAVVIAILAAGIIRRR
jgi:hypothetical protein